ncbi:DUF3973 domain-containing protein [Peribacillus sp. NPDC096540]|uniref:DUF3973 domain-containing protein n=1 Tax=Peribacillus sp. NPDC096540 TaxID=3390612 RepID=UPI003D033EBB
MVLLELLQLIKEVKEMYYCIVCSKLHNQKSVDSKIFESGFYIDPFLENKVHLGMCNKEEGENF